MNSAGKCRTERNGIAKRIFGIVKVLALLALLTSCSSSAGSQPPTATPLAAPLPTATPLATATPLPPPSPTVAKQRIDFKPCTLANNIKAECGKYSVYENRETLSGRKIELAVAVVKAATADRAPDPMVYLAGGPGGAATQDFVAIGPAFGSLNQHHDWLLIDQRGTGGSNRLLYPPLPPAAYTATTQAEAEAILKPWMEDGLKRLNGDPRFYTTQMAVDDIDEVAQSLGYAQVNLYGGSYGATTVQYYLRLHPAHVRTAIMDGGTMVDIPAFELMAHNGQRALDLVFKRCEADTLCHAKWPNVRSEMQAVFDRLGKEPATVKEVDDPVTQQPIVFTQAKFSEAVRSKLLSAANATNLPRQIHHAYEGDYSGLASSYLGSQMQITEGGRLAMTWAIRCSEQWARYSPVGTAKSGKGTYFVDWGLYLAQQTEIGCQVAPKGPVPADDGIRVKSDVPVLMMNGDADPQDPPENVANADRELPNSLRVTVPGQGHGVIQSGCLYKVAQDFVDSGTTKGLDTSCVEQMPLPPFNLSD